MSMSMFRRPQIEILGLTKSPFQSCENFVSAVACLNLLVTFLQPKPGIGNLTEHYTAVSSEAWAKLREWAVLAG